MGARLASPGNYGPVAQLVERGPEEPGVGGSNPPRSAKFYTRRFFFRRTTIYSKRRIYMAAYYKLKTEEELRQIVEESETLAEVMRKLGYSGNRGNSIKGLKKYLDELNIDYSKFSLENLNRYSHPRNELEDILVSGGSYTNMTRLKIRVMRSGALGDRCEICGLKEWMGKPLVLQLDHKNGNNRDNRIENLRLLCPNCHSQTETFCKKNKTKE